MRFQPSLAVLSGLLAAGPAFAVPCMPKPGAGPVKAQLMGAAYITTNEESNSVLAVAIDKNGMLAKSKMVATGGCGSVSLDSTKQPVKADPLVSQSALTVAGQARLF